MLKFLRADDREANSCLIIIPFGAQIGHYILSPSALETQNRPKAKDS